MTINHLNLVLRDVKAGTDFFTRYFGFSCTGVKGDHAVVVLHQESFTLVLMSARDGDASYPAAFHIGFMQDSAAAVTAIYDRLKADGLAVGDPPRKIRDSFGFYINYDNLMIEVGHYLNEATA